MANIFAGLEKKNNVNGQTGNTANIFAGLEKQETPYERYRRQYNLNNNAGSSDDEPGFFSGFKSGVAGVFGGQARFGEVNSPFGGDTLGEAADYFEGIAKDNARTKFTEGPELSLDYITDPQGLRYDVGNTVGSGAALGLETAAAAAAVAHSPFAAGAAAVGRAVPALAKLWNSPLGKVVVGNVAQTPLEAISEGGNLVPELRQAGYSEDEIQEIANRAAALNIGGLGLSNLIQSYGASKVLGLLKNGAGKMTAAEIAKRGALGAAGGGASNYFEEGMQNAIGDIAMDRPIDWQEAELQARTGGVTGAVLGGLGGTGGAYMQSRRAQNAEQAESEQPAAGANIINRVRALEGQIPYEAPDGTNCMRTLGLALAGTPYENQINVDQAIATATANGQLMNPAEYTPQPGDLAVVNNGNHIVMVTENGGTIQNGASHNGVYESEQSPADMFGGVQYYIRTSDYNNGRAGVGRRDLRSMYADDTDQAIADMNNTPAIRLPEQRQDIDFSGRGEVEDNSALNSFNEADARRAMARNEAADYAELTGEETDNVQQWNTPQQRTLRMPRRTGGVTYNPVTATETPYLDRLNRQAVNRRADDLAMENQRVMQETAGRRQRFTGQGTPTFRALMQRTLAARSQRQQNLNNALRSNNLANLTARAMSGDHGARQTFDKLRPEVRSVLLNRAIDRLNVQNMDEQSDEARKALKLAQEQQETKERAQREADKRELLQGAEEYLRSSYDSPAEGARAELRDAKAGINSLLQPIIDQLREGMGNGVTLAPGREDGRMVRISNNAPWYQEWHKEHKRKPTQRELEDIARDIYTGRNSYGLPGWEVNQENEAEFEQNRATLQEMDDFVDAYEQLEKKFAAEPNGGRRSGTSEESNAGEVAARGQAETEQTDNQNAEAESEVSKKAKEVVANLQAEDVDNIVKQTADKKGDKKAALREFKKRVSGADEVLYIWEGLTGRSRPSADQQASQSNAELHLSGDNIIPQSEAENKTAPNTVGNAQDGARQAETGRQEQTPVRARKPAKKPKAEAKFTAKGEKLIPQTAELRGNEITVISKPAKNAANSERLIGVELPEGEYTITVDEWKKAENGRLGNANYNWAKLVQRKYAEAFPNTGVKADTPFIAGNDPFHIRIIDNQITAIKQAVKAYDEKVSADTASAANDTQLSPQVSKRINGWAEQFGLDAGMLRSLIAAKPTESNINEFGRFSALKATADKQKVKAFFDNLHNDNLPMRRVSALFDSQLRQLIFALADRPTGTQQIKAAAVQPQAAQANRFDGNRAESALDKLIGRKQPKQQEQQTGKKFMNVFDESELEAEIAKAKAEMSKLSANPFFNPALMKSLFKIGGIYMQRGVNNFADWSAHMVETLGSKVRPFLKSAWDALQAYPSDVKFNDDIMTATLEFVGSRVDNGRSRDEIRNEFTEMYGDEYVAYVDAAYEGVNSYPTEIAENADVVNETETQTETEQPQAEAAQEPAALRSSEEVLRELQDALPNGKFEDAGNGEYTVTLPNNARIKVNIADRMVVNNHEAARVRGAHGLMRGGELNIEGSWQSFKGSDVDGLLNLSRTGRAGTAYHEVMHAAMDLALTEKEQQAMAKHFNKEAQATGKTVSEAISDGYVEWKRARAQRRGTLFGKLFNKMQDMLNTLKSLFTGVENAHNVMRRVESGEVWQRSRGTLYSGDSAPKFNVSSNKISQFVNVALKNADKNLRLLLGKVSNGEAKAIKDSTGYDVSGFTHVWLSEDVRHIQNRHGVKTEKVKGQIGLSEADMIEALEAIKSPNRIEKGSPTSNGEPSIRFIKQTGTGEYTVVEVVRQKNKRLAVKTMWKTASENTKEAATATLRADNSPQYTSETDSGETASMRKNNNKSSSFNQNISQQSPEVNGNDVQYSAEELTPEQKAAQAFTNTERKTTWQSAKDWVKKQRTEFYRDWIDKNDSLHGLDEAIEMTTGIKTDGDQSVYNRVQTLPATAAGMANALIEGDSNSLKALNERLKNKKLPHNVTMQMVLENINREKMDKAHPNYLKRGGFKNWIDAFGAYLGSIRLNEMLLLHDEAYQQKVKEWEANGSKGKKPEYKPYLLPKGLTQDDLESVIKNAPPEFKKAAQMYWQFNDNVLSVMEDAGLISGETHKLLNTKYKYYCPLMRDFSDTAAADNFINGLSNGGRGIGNVSSMLRRISIEGSERNVINPLESTVKAVAVMCNRAERNKVGQMAVELAQKGGLDAVIQEAEGTVADPKNCIFTVMFDGKKQAYKTTQELYGPIVGYNLPAAGFVLGVARNAARLLRAGATTSPSFIIRNLIRDTVFAGVSSKNGFMPIVDTIRGAYALAHDPRLRAEFKVAGVTQFNFYSSSEQIVKSLDEMAGGKALKDYGAADIWRALMKYPAFASEFIESSTRMGEFMKARKKGASLEEAAQAARELTLDFSRSGVQGEKVNQIVPFFNAVLQGGDKMVRLIKQDPVGTGTKLAMYIVLPSLALWALNHDEDWYKEIDPEVKATCWLLPGGLRIPKPQEAGILFGSGIEAVLDQAFNKDPEAIGNWAKVFGGNMAPSIMPTIFLPLLEWQANYSFFRGQSITPQRLQNLPDELQYTPNTSALARTVGGVLKLSPVKIDNTIRGYTGTMGMTLVQQLDWFADEKQNMPYKKVSEWPFLRDFTVNQNIQNRSVDDFYKMLNKANEQHAGYGKKGKPTPAVQGVRKAGQLISKAQKDIRELTVNPRLSPEAKRQRIDQRKAYIKNVAEKANMRFGRFFDD